MRRSPLFRSLAAILAIWFPLVSGEPGIVHPCAVHGGAPSQAAAPSQHQHHAVAPAAAETSHDSAPSHQHHQCSCVSCCVASSAALVAPHAPTFTVALVDFPVVSAVPAVEALARPAPEFSRPYTTGPPRA